MWKIEQWIQERSRVPGPMERLIRSSSGYVLAVPDISFLGVLMQVDGQPSAFDPNKIGGLVRDLERKGTVIPNNFNLLGKRFYTLFLRDQHIPLPDFEILDQDNRSLSPEQMTRLVSSSSRNYPRLFIVKSTESHRGENIRVVAEEELGNIRSQETGLIIQKFWWPRKEDGSIRDSRVVTINGEPVAMAVRETKDPIINSAGDLIEYPPRLSRVLSNIVQGGKVVRVKPDLRQEYFDLAREACQAIREYASGVRKLIMHVGNPQEVNLGLLAIDIIEGEEGLAVNEVDTFPGLDFFPGTEFRLIVRRYVDYLKSIAETQKKEILIIDLEQLFGKNIGISMPVEAKELRKLLAADNIPYAVPVLKKG